MNAIINAWGSSISFSPTSWALYDCFQCAVPLQKMLCAAISMTTFFFFSSSLCLKALSPICFCEFPSTFIRSANMDIISVSWNSCRGLLSRGYVETYEKKLVRKHEFIFNLICSFLSPRRRYKTCWILQVWEPKWEMREAGPVSM